MRVLDKKLDEQAAAEVALALANQTHVAFFMRFSPMPKPEISYGHVYAIDEGSQTIWADICNYESSSIYFNFFQYGTVLFPKGEVTKMQELLDKLPAVDDDVFLTDKGSTAICKDKCTGFDMLEARVCFANGDKRPFTEAGKTFFKTMEEAARANQK